MSFKQGAKKKNIDKILVNNSKIILGGSKMGRIDYQNKIIEILDEAVSKLQAKEFEVFLENLEKDLEEYKN